MHRNCGPSVCNVNQYVSEERILEDRFGRLSLNVEEIPAGSASGFVWEDGEHIITNYHVVAA